jgi:putative oxidoreductase
MKITVDLNLKLVIRWFLGFVLLWAAVSKIANLQDFHASLLAYKLPLPAIAVRGVAMLLPWLELLCGLMLLAGLRLDAALAWSIALFGIFALATGQAWARGLDISCGCFNLHAIGLESNGNEGMYKFLESVEFAFFRALLFLAGAIFLFRGRIWARPELAMGLPSV